MTCALAGCIFDSPRRTFLLGAGKLEPHLFIIGVSRSLVIELQLFLRAETGRKALPPAPDTSPLSREPPAAAPACCTPSAAELPKEQQARRVCRQRPAPPHARRARERAPSGSRRPAPKARYPARALCSRMRPPGPASEERLKVHRRPPRVPANSCPRNWLRLKCENKTIADETCPRFRPRREPFGRMHR